VHLGEADPGRDIVLVQLLEEPQHDDLALQLRQPRHQARQRQQILWLLPSLRLGDQVAQATVGVVTHGLVQRQLPAAARSGQRLQDLLFAHLQVLGQLAGGGGAAQTLVQLLGHPGQPQGLFLERPGDLEPPAGCPADSV
jgi:hypothetical protein